MNGPKKHGKHDYPNCILYDSQWELHWNGKCFELSWSTLTDKGIFNWFDQIWRNLFCYYSGCQNRKNSYEVSKDPWVFTLASNFFLSLFLVSLLSLQLAFDSRFLSHSWDPIMLWNQDCDMKLTIMATIIEKFATWKWL